MKQTSRILAKNQFRLKSDVPEEDRESFMRFDNGSNFTKTIGLA